MESWKETDGSWSPQRPDKTSMPKVRVLPGPGRSFLNMEDYVLTVHEMLVSQRSRILKELGLITDGSEWPSDTQLWVNALDCNTIEFFNTVHHDMEHEWNPVAFFASAELQSESMSGMGNDPSEYVPVYPARLKTDEEFAALQGVWSSLAFYRIRWKLREGPVRENITVLDDVFDPNSSESPFQNENGEYHEIAALPFSRPPRSHLEIQIDLLDGIEAWKEEGGSWSPAREDPASAPRLEITAGEGRDFISIGDYISQTNEWLVSLRPKILKEVGLQTDCRVWEPDTELWVDP